MTHVRTSANMNFSSLQSVSIGVFSLIFVLYIFILPTYKKIVSANDKLLKSTYKKVRNTKNVEKLQKVQGIIYKNSKLLNSLSISMVVSTVLFAGAIVSSLFFDTTYFSYIIMSASILYDLYFIVSLAFVVGNFYSKKMEEIEELIEKQNQTFERPSKRKRFQKRN